MINPGWRRFAPLGLYLAGLAALASIGLYIVQRQWNLYLQISLGLVVIGLALFAVLDPERVRVALTGRQARYGSNALVMSIAFIGILVVINYIVYKNPKRWDLTEDKQNTLAKETVDTLKGLPSKVEAQAFFTARSSTDYAKGLLDQYKFSSNGKFDYQFIDPEADPVSAQNAGITADGTIVMKMGGRTELVKVVSEKEMTAALVRLMTNEVVPVYFLTGHGERSLDTAGDNSLTQLKSTLESKRYQVKTLNLAVDQKVPDDARVIVVAGPTKPVTVQEVELLKGFLDKGGALIVMEEPLLVTEFGDEADPLADYLTTAWGITLGKDIVIDQSSQQPLIAVAAQYSNDLITQKLQGIISYFPSARSVQAKAPPSGVTATELVFTGSQSWAETDLAAMRNQQQVSPDQNTDLFGPVPLAVSAEMTANARERVVVFGDSDFAADANFSRYANGDLIVNAIDWSAENENLINLTPKTPIDRVLLPPQKYSIGMVLLGSVFVIPGLVLVAGVVVWIQRRRRG
jgi:ABC-type uncharacterized transport system involved in gliding motility auxiliary subunit